MSGFIARNQAEIAGDRALRRYGVLLSLVQVVTFFWFDMMRVEHMLERGREAICWPLFERCEEARVFTTGALRGALFFYLGLGLASALGFALRPKRAYWFLLAAEAMKLAIVAQDFRLRMNQHYMAGFVTLTFLFLPDKRRVIRYLVVFFYFWAGTLKLNQDWLSGAALYRPIWLLTGPWLRLGCAYVVALELVLVFGLLSTGAIPFYLVLTQLVLFQLFSWPVVGFFYPLLMLGILTIFPLSRAFPNGERPLLFRAEKPTTYALLALFTGLQLFPSFFPGDTAITGEGRLFALHMFDARVECHASARLRDESGRALRDVDLYKPLSPRITCDPIVYLSRARTLCRTLRRSEPTAFDFDVHLESKRASDSSYRPVLAIPGYCHHPPSYSLLRPNDWILH